MTQIYRHLVSTVVLGAVTLNLLFWIPGLVLCALVNWLLPRPKITSVTTKVVDFSYRCAVKLDTWLLTHVLKIDNDYHGIQPIQNGEQYLVLSNHQSWFDILIVQALIVSNGPLLKFLIKRELIYVPVVGWICLALKFPRLHRGKKKDGKQEDIRSVKDAVMELDTETFALLNFSEGTRFTRKKHTRQNSPYKHLLRPRAGGLEIMLHNMPKAKIIDITLTYPEAGLNFWQCLSGRLRQIVVHCDYYQVSDIKDPKSWIQQRWQEKDQLIDDSSSTNTQSHQVG